MVFLWSDSFPRYVSRCLTNVGSGVAVIKHLRKSQTLPFFPFLHPFYSSEFIMCELIARSCVAETSDGWKHPLWAHRSGDDDGQDTGRDSLAALG